MDVHYFKMLNRLLLWSLSPHYLDNTPGAVPTSKDMSDFDICIAVPVPQNKHDVAAYVHHEPRDKVHSLLGQPLEISVCSNRKLLDKVKQRAANVTGNSGNSSGSNVTGQHILRKEREANGNSCQEWRAGERLLNSMFLAD